MERVETILPRGEIVEIKKLEDGTYKVVQDVEEVSKTEEFVLVEASELSLDDDFMQYEPKTAAEKITKQLIKEVIDKGIKDFYRPITDPSFSADGENICFEKGKQPAIGKTYDWWKRVAKEYNPGRNSRLGTRHEYFAFLGVLIKNIVKCGWPKKRAWFAVCNYSHELGHYWNSQNAKHTFEPTGSRCICGFYDLINTRKILDTDGEIDGFWLAGGDYNCLGYDNPLAELMHYIFHNDDYCNYSVGWIVLEK